MLPFSTMANIATTGAVGFQFANEMIWAQFVFFYTMEFQNLSEYSNHYLWHKFCAIPWATTRFEHIHFGDLGTIPLCLSTIYRLWSLGKVATHLQKGGPSCSRYHGPVLHTLAHSELSLRILMWNAPYVQKHFQLHLTGMGRWKDPQRSKKLPSP